MALSKLPTKSFLGLLPDFPLFLWASARDASQLVEVNRGIVEELTNIDGSPFQPLTILYALQDSWRLVRLLLSIGVLLGELLRLKMQIQVIVVDRFFCGGILQDHVLGRFDLLLFTTIANDSCLLLHLQSWIRVDLLLVHELLLTPVELWVC